MPNVALINAEDLGTTRRRIAGEEEVRRMRRTLLVDSGAYPMAAINEAIKLGWPAVCGKASAHLKGGEGVEYNAVGPLMVKFTNRTAACNTFVLTGRYRIASGAMPLEETGVRIAPTTGSDR